MVLVKEALRQLFSKVSHVEVSLQKADSAEKLYRMSNLGLEKTYWLCARFTNTKGMLNSTPFSSSIKTYFSVLILLLIHRTHL